MKRFPFILLLLAISTSSVSAIGRVHTYPGQRAKTVSATTLAAPNVKADASVQSVGNQYAQGKISADSVINLALYHKVGNRDLAVQYLKLINTDTNPRAATELGVIYLFTPEYAGNKSEGLRLLQNAAQAGYNEANGYLGYYYYQNKDYAKAKSYFDAATPMTLAIEPAALGGMYLEGKGVREDGKKAREYFQKSALMGLPRGMALYASLLTTKNGGKQDYPDAFFWHYLAGELGDNYSRVMLYRPMLPEAERTDEVGKDAQTALSWIEKVHTGKNMKNEPLYKDGFIKGLKAREQSAANGDDWSRFYLAGMNYNGDFLNQNYAQAMRYYEPIARNGKLPRPMLALVHERLSEMYRDGKGTQANPAEAARHARIAAQYGSLPAYKLTENIR